MSSTNGRLRRFRLSFSRSVGNNVKRMLRRALRLGKEGELILALKKVQRALEYMPQTVGEPLYHLQTMKLEVRIVIVRPVFVEYAVHTEDYVVYIKRIRWTPEP
jgi:hypothetical protein